MNPMTGWALAAAALVVGWFSYGWQGLVMAISVVAFWLLLQISRALRVMRKAGEQPVGRIGSAVMLQSRLAKGQTMMQVVGMTRSLGRKVDGQPDSWAWEDEGGVVLSLHFVDGKLQRWVLERPAGTDTSTSADGPQAAENTLPAAPAARQAAPVQTGAASPAPPHANPPAAP